MKRYKVIAKNLQKVEEALRQEWPTDPGYTIMRSLIGTEDHPPKSCDGDAFVIKEVLVFNGCVWALDFYIKTVIE